MYLAEKTKKISFIKQPKATCLSVSERTKVQSRRTKMKQREFGSLIDWNAKRYTESKRVYINIRPLTYLSGQSCLFAIISTMQSADGLR